MRTPAFVLLLLTFPALSDAARAQNVLDEARAQYEAAAYEEALATLTRIGEGSPPANRVQLEQYRALCLIALGNMSDAERAVAALVAADPLYVPSPSVASPKVLSLVADIRKKELPAVARRLLDSGRTAFQAKDLERAQQQFDLLLKLLDDPAMSERPEREDLRTLAEGFVTLAAAASAPPPVSAPEPAPAIPDKPSPAAPPANGGGSAPTLASDFFVPATPIDQRMPEWHPPSAAIAGFEYNGRMRLRIGPDGKVTSAVIEQMSHPLYDARLLEVAPTWTYKPATRNGVPIESEKVIVITLRTER